jgi:hypothetical protein
VIVPWDWLGVAVRRTPSWFRCVSVASLDHHANSLERIGDDLALRRTNDVGFTSEDQDEDSEVEHDEAQEERSPEALGLFHERSRDQRQGAKVDTPIENHCGTIYVSWCFATSAGEGNKSLTVDPLVCDGRIDDGTFPSLLDLDGHKAALVLVGNQGRNVGLDATSAEADDNNC